MNRWAASAEVHDCSPNEASMTSILFSGDLLATHTSLTAGSGDDTRAACVAAVREDRDRIARRLNAGIIRGVFGATIRLSATAAMSNGAMRARLQLSIDDLDLIIAEVRATIFDCAQGSLHAFDDLTAGSDLEPMVATMARGQEAQR